MNTALKKTQSFIIVKVLNSFKNNYSYKVFMRDQNGFGGGLMLYLDENIPYKFLKDHLVDATAAVEFH